MTIVGADPCGDGALALLHEAALEARALYPELFAPGVPMPTNPPAAPRTVYLLAWEDDDRTPAGCAALRPIDDTTAEVRRVFVTRMHRSKGIARALMTRLQAEARTLGYSALVLETGNRQQPAMALYAALGYTRIAPFGAHVGDPTSVCFGRNLSAEAAL